MFALFVCVYVVSVFLWVCVYRGIGVGAGARGGGLSGEVGRYWYMCAGGGLSGEVGAYRGTGAGGGLSGEVGM